ncbi:MAG: carboxylesterase family protein [Synergistaceae bacterium]|nr:carboxylesterase family protein [Synergistaceae bacterium]
MFKKFSLATLLILALSSCSFADVRTLSPLAVSEDSSGKFTVILSGDFLPSTVKAWDASGDVISRDSLSGDAAVFTSRPSLVKYVYQSAESGDVTAILASDDAQYLAYCSNGLFVGKDDDLEDNADVISWLGIPFAKSTAGTLRWKAPQDPESSDETKTAQGWGHSCVQGYSSSYENSISPQDEDCLNLNVWKRKGSVSDKPLPVIVYVYGGGFSNGDPSMTAPVLGALQAGANFVHYNEGLIFVSIAYRVGVLGFIDFSGVPGGEDYPDAGNLGLLDCAQAVKWVHDNIAAFGGDPDNITLCGFSSGASLISFLVTMPQANQYIRRAIMESGTVSMCSPKSYSMNLAAKLLEETGASTMSELAALPSRDIKSAATNIAQYLAFPERDGKLIPEDDPYGNFSNAASVDILIGSNADEVRYWIFGMGSFDYYAQAMPMAYEALQVNMPEAGKTSSDMFVGYYLDNRVESEDEHSTLWGITEYFNDLLFRGPLVREAGIHARSSGSGKTYMYYWNYPAQADNLAMLQTMAAQMAGYTVSYDVLPLGACHVAEVPYVLAHPHFMAANPDMGVVIKTLSMWGNFAKTGNPSANVLGLDITWPEYSPVNGTTLVISRDGSVSASDFLSASNPLGVQYQLIDGILDYGVSGCEIINGNFEALPASVIVPQTKSDDTKPVTPDNTTPSTPDNTNPTTPGNTSPTTPDGTSQDQTVQTRGVGSSSGGCDSGLGAVMMLAVVGLMVKRRR